MNRWMTEILVEPKLGISKTFGSFSEFLARVENSQTNTSMLRAKNCKRRNKWKIINHFYDKLEDFAGLTFRLSCCSIREYLPVSPKLLKQTKSCFLCHGLRNQLRYLKWLPNNCLLLQIATKYQPNKWSFSALPRTFGNFPFNELQRENFIFLSAVAIVRIFQEQETGLAINKCQFYLQKQFVPLIFILS